MLSGDSHTLRGQSARSSLDPCPQQLTYRIGYVDPQINQSEEELLDLIRQVEVLWESAVDRDLLDYEINGEVAIHFVYKEHHDISDRQMKFSERIQRTKHRILGMRQEYDRVSKEYRNHKQLLLDHVSRLDSLHYKKSDTRKTQYSDQQINPATDPVHTLSDSIVHLKDDVDHYRNEMERHSRQIQDLIDQQRKIIYKYNQIFEENARFKQGIYRKGWPDDRIYVFQFTNIGELKAVLAHELGHALGIGHVDNPQSIMYKVLEKQNIYNLSLTKEDKEAARNQCES
jgi:chromosome segregation ATPase